jgi:hypothetical protein
MAFKLARSPSYNTKVVVVMPGENGQNETSDFVVTFKRYDTKALEALRNDNQYDVVRGAITNFTNLLDDKGAPVEFNEQNLDVLLAIPQAIKALAETFWETQYSAKTKN